MNPLHLLRKILSKTRHGPVNNQVRRFDNPVIPAADLEVKDGVVTIKKPGLYWIPNANGSNIVDVKESDLPDAEEK